MQGYIQGFEFRLVVVLVYFEQKVYNIQTETWVFVLYVDWMAWFSRKVRKIKTENKKRENELLEGANNGSTEMYWGKNRCSS